MKIGRRGSMSASFTARGVQGHSAYPHRAKNAASAMITLLGRLSARELDRGNAHFDASTLAVTTIDTGNPAGNVIPANCHGHVNIRFNSEHSGVSLGEWMQAEAAKVEAETGVVIEVKITISGEAFVTPPGPLSDLVGRVVQAETNRTPELSTSGGTSDARFITHHCPVVEFGLVGPSMHKVDEHVEVAHIHQLKTIYSRLLKEWFA